MCHKGTQKFQRAHSFILRVQYSRIVAQKSGIRKQAEKCFKYQLSQHSLMQTALFEISRTCLCRIH